jgi:hypothetical protein
MIALELGATRVDEALRVVQALGAHRYVGGHLHIVHAFAIAAMPDDASGVLAEAIAWAKDALADERVDAASRDGSPVRRRSDAELAAILDGFWTPGPRSRKARDALATLIERYHLPLAGHAPFDESTEPEIHPLLIDAGWELLPLSQLDKERHAGGIGAFGDPPAFESARLGEQATTPPTAHLVELPAIGPVELLRGARDDGTLAQSLVVWLEGNETYLDYVMRGVRRAAKL